MYTLRNGSVSDEARNRSVARKLEIHHDGTVLRLLEGHGTKAIGSQITKYMLFGSNARCFPYLLP